MPSEYLVHEQSTMESEDGAQAGSVKGGSAGQGLLCGSQMSGGQNGNRQ